MPDALIFRQLFDYESWTYTYLLADPLTREAALIDTVKEQAERDLSLLRELGLKLKYLLETHVHADHISGAALLRAKTGAKIGLSAVAGVKAADLQLKEGDQLLLGRLAIRVLSTPGHTNTCMSFCWEGRVFTGDTLFIRDAGRTDFQEGSQEKMYDSVTRVLFSLPESTVVYPGHDYKGNTSSTIAEEKAHNSKLGGGRTLAQFKELMAAMKLGLPKKIHIAVPANMECGGS
jgi:glyoxylase-like metal-dependent hydrolase (beta-lactamase superfamily II)